MKQGISRQWARKGVIRESKVETARTRRLSTKTQASDLYLSAFVAVLLFAFGLLFFRSFFFSLLFASLVVFFPAFRRKRLAHKRKALFLVQFKDGMYSISNSLRAGSSLQIALKRCEEDLRKELITHREKPMLEEIERINHDIEFGMSVDQSLVQFKEAMQLEDVTQFVDAMLVTRSKGGNLTHVIQNTAERIAEKISIQQEIQVATSQKRLEASVLTVFPIVLVLLIMVANPEYMQPMYETWFGNFLLFLAAVMLVANYVIGKKVTNIDI